MTLLEVRRFVEAETEARVSHRVGRTLKKFGLFSLLGMMVLVLLSSAVELVAVQTERLAGTTEASPLDDHVTFYAAGRMLLDGQGRELYDIDRIASVEREAMGRPVGGSGVLPYFNPPFVAVLYAPLAMLPVGVFSTVLAFIVAAMVIGGSFALQALVQPVDRMAKFALWITYLSFLGTIWLLIEQQISMLLFFGWFGFAWFQFQGAHRLSGASLALALVKPQSVLLILALLVWKRQWQALLAFSAIALSLVLVSIGVSGPSILIEYPRFLLDSTRWEGQGVDALGMFGWNRVVASLTGDSTPDLGVMAVPTIATIVLSLVAFKGPWRAREPRFFLQCACLLLATLLLNPHLYLQDMVLLALVMGFIAAYMVRVHGRIGIMTASMAIAFWLLMRVNWNTLEEVPLVTVAMGVMACWLAFGLSARRVAAEAAASVTEIVPNRGRSELEQAAEAVA